MSDLPHEPSPRRIQFSAGALKTLGSLKRLPRRLARSRAGLAFIAAIGLLIIAPGALIVAGYRTRPLLEVELPAASKAVQRGRSAEAIEAKLRALAPGGIYIIVDTSECRLYLMQGDRVLREAVCSAGTGAMLEDPKTGRRWIFDTPRGMRRIRDKIERPVWRQPDWYFIEEGMALPEDAGERFDPVAMGDYAMDIGGGYFIHGTLYRRLLGQNVTHGCIRLGDEDLAAVFHAVSLGTPVFIY